MLRFFMGTASALLVVSTGFLIFAALAHVSESELRHVSQQAVGSWSPGILIALGGLVLTSFATIAGIFFGWRRDRREAQLLQLQVQKLELENTQLQKLLADTSEKKRVGRR